MKANLTRLVGQAKNYLLAQHGFTLRNSRFTREDQLVRSVWFWPAKNATAQSYGFDVLLDLGIPLLSPLSDKAQEWVVRASCDKMHRKLTVAPRVKFAFQHGDYDSGVEEVVLTTLRVMCDEFFLKLQTAEDLYRFVKRNAEEFGQFGMGAENEFKRFDLMPWNAVPRLELAAVYAAFLGRVDESQALRAEAVAYAEKNGIDYMIPTISANIERAAGLGRKA